METTSNDNIDEWTLDGVLDELSAIHYSMQDRQFAFILGAGASVTSGIPTGKTLAENWLKEIHKRECKDGTDINEWIKGPSIGIEGLTYSCAAEFYPKIFERRFRHDREAGYAALERAMEQKSPSLGYSLLAEVIQNSRHKVVITTNFDNLVADALAMHAHQSPLVVAHESLAGFVRPQLRRPLVAKIHRDLYLEPQNDQAGVSTLDKAWTGALRKLFQYFTPVVVGYGGNDGSLMGLLESLEPGQISGRMIWCYRDTPPNGTALRVLKKHKGITVQIPGFDDFMLRLAEKIIEEFNVAAIADRIEELGTQRSKRYRDQSEELQKASAIGSDEKRKSGEVISRSAGTTNTWWAWELKAKGEKSIDGQDEIYRQGISLHPTSSELIGNYANFLADQKKDFDLAESMYKKSIEINANSNNIINYAIFLANEKSDLPKAIEYFEKSIELDDINNASRYANFLLDQDKYPEKAGQILQVALTKDPTNAENLSTLARLQEHTFQNYDAAESLYKRALEIQPNNSRILSGYANFLAKHRNDTQTAEQLFKKSVEIAPSNIQLLTQYAIFLEDHLQDFKKADEYYNLAINQNNNDADTLATYANFLAKINKKNEANELFERALKIPPKSPQVINLYANFVAAHTQDKEKAKKLYQESLSLSPDDPNMIANYAAFLLHIGNHESESLAEKLIEKSIEACGQNPSQVLAETLLYKALLSETRNQNPTTILQEIKKILDLNFPRGDWDFSFVLETYKNKLDNGRFKFYSALTDAILHRSKVNNLDNFTQWKSLSINT